MVPWGGEGWFLGCHLCFWPMSYKLGFPQPLLEFFNILEYSIELREICLLVYYRILWKLIKGNLTKKELGGQKGQLSSVRLQTHQEEIHTLQSQKKEARFTAPAGGRKIFLCPGNNPANERLSKFSQWEATILQTFSFLQWIFYL